MTNYKKTLNKEKLKDQIKQSYDSYDLEYDILRQKKLILQQIGLIENPDEKTAKLKEASEYFKKHYPGQPNELIFTKEDEDRFSELKQSQEKTRSSRGYESLRNFRSELMRAPGKEKFENFSHSNLNKESEDSVPSLEQVRLALNSLPKELVSIFNEYFIVRLVKNNWEDPDSPEGQQINAFINTFSGGAVVEKYPDTLTGKEKFRINVDVDSFFEIKTETFEGGKIQWRTFNINKFLYIITRSILATVNNNAKKEFVEYLKKEEKLTGKHIDQSFDSDDKDNYDDWLAYCLVNDNNHASSINAELTAKAKTWLEKSFKKPDLIASDQLHSGYLIRSSSFDEKSFMKKYWKNKTTGEKIEDKWWIGFFNTAEAIGMGTPANWFYALSNAFNDVKLSFQETIYASYIEEDAKECKRLLARDLGGGDYQKMLKLPYYYNDKHHMRGLLFAIAEKNAYHWTYGQLWLWRFDSVFRNTKGEEVSAEGFDFINRISKASAKANSTVGTVEYKLVGNKFKRMSYDAQVGRMDAIMKLIDLRSVQRSRADIFNNLYDSKSRKFINIHAKLGEVNQDLSDRDKYYIQNDISLTEVLSKKDAEDFVNAMTKYGEANKDEGFNNLLDPVVIAITRKYVQEARREPQLFSMYTSPQVKNAFHYYKNYVGETKYSIDEYEAEFDVMKKDLKDNDYDFEKVLTEKSYDETLELLQDYYKEKREMPYSRGQQKTKYGIMKEYVRQSHDKVMNLLGSLEASPGIISFIREEITKFTNLDLINQSDIDIFNKRFEKELNKLSSEKARKVRMYMSEYMGHLENMALIKGFQLAFKPYEYKLLSYQIGNNQTQKSYGSGNGDKKLFEIIFSTISQSNTTAKDLIKNIENLSDDNISFTDLEKIEIESLYEKDTNLGRARLINMSESKINRSTMPKAVMFDDDKNQLDTLYYDINNAIINPEESENELSKYIKQFLALAIIPDNVKTEPIHSLKDIQYRLKLAMVCADSKKVEEELQNQFRAGRDIYSRYRQYIEEEEELE